MSYATVYLIEAPDNKIVSLTDLRNSHGFAPFVWRALSKQYLGDPYAYMRDTDSFWPIYKREDMPDYQKRVLLMTYDYAVVRRENFSQAASDLRKFYFETHAKYPDYVNHLQSIAEIFDKHASDEAINGICFRCTSVSENLWEGEWDEEKEEYGDFEWPGQSFDVYASIGN